jgi:hypothetical protein
MAAAGVVAAAAVVFAVLISACIIAQLRVGAHYWIERGDFLLNYYNCMNTA